MTAKYNDFDLGIIDARLFFMTTMHSKVQLPLNSVNTSIVLEEELPFLRLYADK